MLSTLMKTLLTKAIEHNFHVVLFIILYEAVENINYVNKTLMSDHSNLHY